MCGIAGHLSFAQPPASLAGMLATLAHRGPDDQGTYDDGPIRLGFRRLAIVDLTEAGQQPMANEDGTVWLVFNGEIYNYRDLTAELRAHGHRFRSQTDSEAIIHAYEQWGTDCLARFNGMFAFALWDARRQVLFCARDRFGVKPFYYTTAGDGSLLFASEIKALFRHARAPSPAANRQLIYDFLGAGLLDHTDETCFAGVSQLLPAHYLLATRKGLTRCRYWELPTGEGDVARQPTPIERRRWAEEFGSLLWDAVRLRLHAEVPVGTCLSGGLDSSSIVCLANQLLFADAGDLPWHARGERQKTFSACYDDPRHDERRFIEQVVTATGADTTYTFPGLDLPLEEVIPQVVWTQDEPFGSTSILAQWHVMRAARQGGITVMLDGQGADETLAGYHGYFGAALADQVAARNAAAFIRDLQLYRHYHHPGWPAIGRGILHALITPDASLVHAARAVGLAGRRVRSWLSPDLSRDRGITRAWNARGDGYLMTLLYNQATRTSLPALLHYEDRNSMAFSIEARTPFLDYRLAEFLFRLPGTAHLAQGLTKRVLRDAMRGVLPEPVRTRLDKKGFSTPEDAWFRTSLQGWVRDILHSSSLAQRGFVSPTPVQSLFERYLAGRFDDSMTIWRIVSVELWARAFLDAQPTVRD